MSFVLVRVHLKLWLSGLVLFPFQFIFAQSWVRFSVQDSLVLTQVWSGHPVDFALQQSGDSLYLAYYDANRRMTIGLVNLKTRAKESEILNSTVGWDSHNSIALSLDTEKLLHVSGNMHVNPLVYFRGQIPGDIHSFKTATPMIGSQEASVTYPLFFSGLENEFYFTYRDGGSGNGNQVFNVWNPNTKTWSRLLNKLFDGQGQRSAYPGNPQKGPDGYFHMYWMWRETPDAGTTHDVGYIRSKDFLNWENALGKSLVLPITNATSGVLIEPIAEKSGLINRGGLGFDSQNRPIVSYHRFDANGKTQIFNSRMENGKWAIRQTSDWDYRWDIGGNGTLNMDVTFGPVELQTSGRLIQKFYHVKNGSGYWELDPLTLKAISVIGSSPWPTSLEAPRQKDMDVHWLSVRDSRDSAKIYALRWETLPENQDQPRTTIPPPQNLTLYWLRDTELVTALRHQNQAEKRKKPSSWELGLYGEWNLKISDLGPWLLGRQIRPSSD